MCLNQLRYKVGANNHLHIFQSKSRESDRNFQFPKHCYDDWSSMHSLKQIFFSSRELRAQSSRDVFEPPVCESSREI